MRLFVARLAAGALLASGAWAAPGDLDPSFGDGGVVTTNFGWNQGGLGRAIIQQGDGRIVVAGAGWDLEFGFVLARYETDGSLDASFGDQGRVVTTIGVPLLGSSAWDHGAFALAQRGDGTLVAAGRAWNQIGFDVALIRYLDDGRLDPSFGAGGKVTTSVTYYDFVEAVAVQPDGKVIVAGYSWGPVDHDFLLARYQDDGSLDTTFGQDGILLADFGDRDEAHAVAVVPDGRIVVAGASGDAIAVARFAVDGTLDASFGSGGIATTQLGDSARALAVIEQANGRLLVAGVTHSGADGDLAMARYEPDGTPDFSFGGNGSVNTDLGSNYDRGLAVVQAGERLVVAGTTTAPVGAPFVAVGYRDDGTIDPTFGNAGILPVDFGLTPGNELRILRQADGKLALMGEVGSPGSIGLARYHADGSPDTAFGSDGVVATAAGSNQDEPAAMLRQADGRIVVVGTSIGYDASAIALARYLENGDLDPGFGAGGRVVTDLGDGSGAAGVVQQPSGKLVVGGSTLGANGYDFCLVRYRADGTVDATFGVGGVVCTSIDGYGHRAMDLVQQADGKLVLAGSATIAGSYGFTLVRHGPTGDLDVTFGEDGIVHSAGTGSLLAATQQSDGKLVAAGTHNGYFAIARYLPNGSPDPSFGANGFLFLSSSQTSEQLFRDVLQRADGSLLGAGGAALVRFSESGGTLGVFPGPLTYFAAAELADTKLLGAGSASAPDHPTTHFALARHLSNGAVDADFATDGLVVTVLGSVQSRITDLHVDGNTVLAAGWSNSDFALVRYRLNDCGNGVVDAGEECDDGNSDDGDCCSASCVAEPDGPTSCDGNLCTRTDTCAAGVCVAGPCATGAACSACGGVCEDTETECLCEY